MRTKVMIRLLLVAITGIFAHSGAVADTNLVGDKINKKIDAISFTDLNGKAIPIQSIKGKKAVVIVFLSFECPVSNNYTSLLAEMNKEYSKKGVDFVAVTTSDESPEQIKKQINEFQIPFPVYVDSKLNVADALKATTTPEAFVLDHNFVMRYRGRIDNAYSARLKKNAQTTEHDLKNALNDLLSGKPVSIPVTKPIGCPLLTKAETTSKATTSITYHKDVVPILQNNCQGCHRPGAVGPFSLTTYKQAVNWAEDIKDYTQTRKMPPWKPVDGPAFHNERKLSEKDIQILAQWVDGGTPEGDLKDAPEPKQFVDGWHLGKPDLILTVPDEFYLGASGHDTFRCFVLPTGLTEDKYIIGFQVMPGNQKIVHHTLNFWDMTGKARKLNEESKAKAKPTDNDRGPGYSVAMGIGFQPDVDDLKRMQAGGPPPFSGIGGWAPGQMPRFLPEGAGYFLPKGSDIVVQVHYHRNGKPEKDRTQVGLYFAKKPIEKPWRTIVIDGFPKIIDKFPFVSTIPEGKPDYLAKGSLWTDTDCTIYNVMPHMHLLGKSTKVTMTPPNGEPQVLVDIKEWDYNWQETYWFKDPIKVKRGTRFDIEAIFDNSAKNPNNPNNPPKIVASGDETTDEMLFGFIGATSESKDGRIRLSRKEIKVNEKK